MSPRIGFRSKILSLKVMRKLLKGNSAIGFVLILFLIWQSFLCLLTVFLPRFGLPKKEGYNYWEMRVVNPPFLWSRANFDGIHYLDISRKGYDIHQQAFFPFYPSLIKRLAPLLGGRDLLAGVLLSNFCLLAMLYFLYRLVLLDYKEAVARRSLIFLLVFPTSFFLSAVYNESLFLLLAVLSFYGARKGKWLLAGIAGALASYTRFVGVFIFPALLYEWWQQKTDKPRIKYQSLLPLLLIPLGLLNYMKFLWKNYQDPLLFLHAQPYFGVGRSGGKIILLYQVFWRYWKMILTTRADILYFTVWLELIAAIGFLFLLILSYQRKIRPAYLIFAALAYLTPTFSGTFSSLPRYVLVLFPCFIYLGTIKSKILSRSLLIVFSLLLIISSLLFFRGYWVS